MNAVLSKDASYPIAKKNVSKVKIKRRSPSYVVCRCFSLRFPSAVISLTGKCPVLIREDSVTACMSHLQIVRLHIPALTDTDTCIPISFTDLLPTY